VSRDVTVGGAKVTKTGAATWVLNLAEQTIANICRPSKLLMKLKSGSFDVTAFDNAGGAGLTPQYGAAAQNALDPDPVFSGARTGFTLEGPFLRYEIAATSSDLVDPDKVKINGINTSTDTMKFFFDIVGNRMMLLPYPGKLSVISQYPGSWTFEYFLVESEYDIAMAIAGHPMQRSHEHAVRRGSPLEADATLSLRLARTGDATATTRTFNAVPLGAHSFTYNDNAAAPFVAPTIAISQETAGGSLAKVVGPGAVPVDTLVQLTGTSDQSAFMTRVGHHNAQRVQVTAGTTNVNGFVQWHMSFV